MSDQQSAPPENEPQWRAGIVGISQCTEDAHVLRVMFNRETGEPERAALRAALSIAPTPEFIPPKFQLDAELQRRINSVREDRNIGDDDTVALTILGRFIVTHAEDLCAEISSPTQMEQS